MSVPKTMAVRALEKLSLTQRYLTANIEKPKFSELLTSLKAGELEKLFNDYDFWSIGKDDLGMREEMLDVFCLLRDFRNAQRSRKHIYTQAYQARLRNGYEAFMEFRKVNGQAVTEETLKKAAGDKTLTQLRTP